MPEALLNPVYRARMKLPHGSHVLCMWIALALHVRAGDAQTNLPVGAGGVTLREVFDSVRANSPHLGAAMARVRAVRGGLSAARAWSNPVISFESEKMSTEGNASSAARETMTTAMVPLEPFYQRGPRIRRAQALVRVTDADLLSQRQQLAVAAADAFYQAALAQERVAATSSLAQWLDTVVTYNTVRVREGVAAEADLIRSQLERDLILNELAMAESELARAEADLQPLVDRRDLAPLRVKVDSLPLDSLITRQLVLRRSGRLTPRTVPESREGGAGIVARPQVEAARERLLASEAGIASERRMLLRELGAMVGTKTAAGATSLVAGFTFPFPLLDQNRGNITAARAERDASRFELEQQERSAKADLLGAETVERILSRRVAAFGTGRIGYLARAEESRRIALGAYREGGTSLFQVIDAARAWREARNSYFETLFAQHRSVIDLLVAEGIDVMDAWPKPRAGASQ